MAFSASGGSGVGRGRSRSLPTMSEMNIVPLVDVVLVLLIIFMLTSSVMEFGLDVQVPKTKNVAESAQELPVVTVNRDGEIYLGDKPVNINELGATIKTRYQSEKGAYVRADKLLTWEVLAQVVSELGRSGVEVKMVIKPEDTSGKKEP